MLISLRVMSLNAANDPVEQEFVELIDDAIDLIALEFAETAHHRKDRNEDSLTIDIVSLLKAHGFLVEHDADVGGHCDVVVRGPRGFLWLGEAKIHSDYEWLNKGYLQLTTRYSTGMVGQQNGCVIIYCKGPDVNRVVNTWRSKYQSLYQEATVTNCPKNVLVFRSVNKHERSGLPFTVRFVPFSLYHKPKDKK
ncbi:hypothetical protein SMB34_06825 [Thalassospira permensis NBRC 106175]|uniref:NERD domain-containing protein n=2 Tax=Thalassospira permensis TaxID=680197 RepID=A0ABR4TKR8_9PROT|nr:hypothetical protein SMB34_06825 [Thalassospira permensis NBRC 106175]